MKTFKKITALAVAVVMIMSLCSFGAFAEGETKVFTVTADRTDVGKGDTFAVNFTLAGVDGSDAVVSGLNFEFEYDNTKLEITEDDANITVASSGKVKYLFTGAMFGTTITATSGAPFATINVTVKDAAEIGDTFEFVPSIVKYSIPDDTTNYSDVAITDNTDITVVPAPISKDAVVEAVFADKNGAVAPNATYSIGEPTQEDDVITVNVTATDVAEHKNGEGNLGYWTGFAVKAPAADAKFKYAFGENELSDAIAAEDIGDGVKGVAFYFNATEASSTKNVKLQWVKEDGTALSAVTNFVVNIDVTYNWIKADAVVKANLVDKNGAVAPNATYEVTKAQEADVITVDVAATDVAEHKNGEGNLGYWTGFAVEAPATATQMKYAIGDNDLSALTPVEDLGDGKKGIAFYFNATELSSNKAAKLQWFDAAGNALSAATNFVVNIDVTYNWIKKADVKAANIVSADGKAVFSANSVAATGDADAIAVAVTTERLKKHKNANDVEGFWTGFSVVAPANATQMKYGFGTAAKPALGELTAVEANVFEGKSGIAFFTDAKATTPKTYASLQWFDAAGNALSAVTYFEMDLSGVTYSSNGGGTLGGIGTAIGGGGTTTKPEDPTVDPEDPAVDPEDPTVDPEDPTTPGTPGAGLFEDVPADHWAVEYIKEMKDMGVVSGKSATTFEPDATITRAEFVKMIATAFGLEATATDSAFEDCGADDWYTPYVVAAAEAGYVKGISETAFGANSAITRQDICTILGRILGLTAEDIEVAFTDVDDIADYALDYVKALAAAGILNGYEDGTFAPTKNATRAEVCKILSSLLAMITEEAPEEDAAEEDAVVEDVVEEDAAAEEEAVVEEEATEEEAAEEATEEEVVDEK